MKKLEADQLHTVCSVKDFACKTSAELTPLEDIVGQKRALSALEFGLRILDKGFNVYVAGMPGTGRTSAVQNFLEILAAKEKVPSDWCYVSNFSNQYQPKALELPPGIGCKLVASVDSFIEAARSAITQMLESEEYARQREERTQSFESLRDKITEQMQEKAKQAGFVLQGTQTGFLMLPVIEGKPVTPDIAAQLPKSVRTEIETRRDALEKELRALFRKVRGLERELMKNLRKMEENAIRFTLDPLVSELEEEYKDFSQVVEWLRGMTKDIIQNINSFIGRQPAGLPAALAASAPSPETFAKRYQINLIVDNSELKGAPVVIVTNPNYTNLFGRIEKEPRFGALVTDFSMIRAGALHQANGGYIVIPTRELLTSPGSYAAVKRALKHDQIVIEEPAQAMGFFTVKTLRPEPIPLKIKVITIGEGIWYHQLYSLDPDFRELFKVKAEFDTTMERTLDNIKVYGSFVCSLTQKEGLRPLTVDAIAEIVDYSSRLADNQQKLSTRFDVIADVIREANYYAQLDKNDLIEPKQIKRALKERIYRSNLYEEKVREMIEKEFVLIDTKGEAIGQVNGLSVLSLGDFEFGRPSRVTVSVAPGSGRVIDIEREAGLSGPTHHKGTRILSGFLHERFGVNKPLSISARITFEQSYGGVDGDSASSTELYAMLSALSGVPIQQRFAVTGSVNQHGQVQAIGGVNEKIEGYFDVCTAQGLTGEQGVLIPKANEQNLMLKDEVITAVRKGKFHLYSVETIDQGIELLTGVPAGQRQKDGNFPPETINAKVDSRLQELATIMRTYHSPINRDDE